MSARQPIHRVLQQKLLDNYLNTPPKHSRNTPAMATSIVLETSMGNITVELYADHAPRTCKNFETLVQRGYYNSCPFHRVIPDFMIQGGDPTGTGRGGSSIYGGKFADEIHPSLKHTGAGILSMANSGKDTNGSQLYVHVIPKWARGGADDAAAALLHWRPPRGSTVSTPSLAASRTGCAWCSGWAWSRRTVTTGRPTIFKSSGRASTRNRRCKILGGTAYTKLFFETGESNQSFIPSMQPDRSHTCSKH